MRRMAMAAVVAAAVLSVPTVAAAQLGDNATMTVSVNVIQGLTLTKGVGDLEFGTRAANNTSTTIATVPMAEGIAFTAVGQASQAIAVSFDPLTLGDGAGNSLPFAPAVGGSQTEGGYALLASGDIVNLGGAGHYFFRVGGTITIGANQAPGPYTGTFTLSVAYAGI